MHRRRCKRKQSEGGNGGSPAARQRRAWLTASVRAPPARSAARQSADSSRADRCSGMTPALSAQLAAPADPPSSRSTRRLPSAPPAAARCKGVRSSCVERAAAANALADSAALMCTRRARSERSVRRGVRAPSPSGPRGHPRRGGRGGTVRSQRGLRPGRPPRQRARACVPAAQSSDGAKRAAEGAQLSPIAESSGARNEKQTAARRKLRTPSAASLSAPARIRASAQPAWPRAHETCSGVFPLWGGVLVGEGGGRIRSASRLAAC